MHPAIKILLQTGCICQTEILEKTLPETKVKVMLLVGWRLDTGLARSISSDHINQLIVKLLLNNVGTMKGRASEITETAARRCIRLPSGNKMEKE